ncbi:PREDICTED: 14 kDa phosphohistidine phosphatase-like, partial [Amphimedon queenslandica]|uniref:14 kDa phosphohistidine phosphatase n=1 Tax=Amphimedon queenslandica TaxID=400682 RepID=A0AAN0IHL2_AMPQE
HPGVHPQVIKPGGISHAKRCGSKMEKVPEVDIESDGVFKYILVELTDKKSGKVKTIVRGYEWAEYHADILDRIAPRVSELGLEYKCVGGGRIRHQKSKSIHVYGYSVDFGQADHKMTIDILKRNFTDYESENITFSNSGY